MSFTSTRKALLTGTALVAVSFCIATAAFAADGLTASTDPTVVNAPVTGDPGASGVPSGTGGFGDDGVETAISTITITNNSVVTGGAGGDGGDGAVADDSGGTSGSGGSGVNLVVDGTSPTARNQLINNAGRSIIGGASGAGGDSGGGDANGGDGDLGGAGVFVDSDYATINNAGSITGGDGGDGGDGTGTGQNGFGGTGGSGIIVYGENASLTNTSTGTITAGLGGVAGTGGASLAIDGDDGTAVMINGGALNFSLNNAGTISGLGGRGVMINETLGSAGFVNTGNTTSTSGTSVAIASSVSVTVFTNSGNITSLTGTAIDAQGLLGNFNNTGGTITSGGDKTIILGGDQTAGGNLVLNGTISNTQANNAAIALSIETDQLSTNRIINTGLLRADGAGAANSGAGIAVAFDGNIGRFENQGTVYGQVTGGANAQRFINSAGTLTGNVDLGAGENAFLITGGTVNGTLTGAADDDTLIVTGGSVSGNINLGNGVNTFDISGGTLGVLTGGADTDLFTIDGGTTGSITMGAGPNFLSLTSGTINGDILGGADSDDISFYGGNYTGVIGLGGGTNLVGFFTDYTVNNAIGASSTVGIAVANDVTLTLNAAVTNLGALSLSAGSVLNHNATNTQGGSGSFLNNGTANIAGDQALNVFNYNASGTGTLGIQYAGSLPGRLNVANGDADLTSSNIVFSVARDGVAVPSGSNVFVAAAGDASFNPASVSDTSLLYDFTVTDAGSNLTVQAVRDADGIGGVALENGGTENNASVGDALDGLSGSTNPEIQAFQNRLASSTSGAEFNDLLESVQPTVDGAAIAASDVVTSQILSLTQTRLAAVRSSDTKSGISTGDGMANHRVWLQPFAASVDQDGQGGIDGYSADTAGVAIGADTSEWLHNMTVGIALSYGKTNADSENINNTDTDIDNYQVQLYGDYDLGDRAFVQGAVGYGLNKIDQSRFNVGGVVGATADADYDSRQFLAAIGVGQTYMPLNNGLMLTPQAGIRYTNLHTDDYTETGVGGLGLAVDTDDVDALDLGVGAELAYDIATEKGFIQPSVHVGYTYDAINDDIQTASSFTGGGASFNINGVNPSPDTFNAGAGLTYYSNGSIDLSVNYDAEMKKDYVGHAGYLKAVTKF